MTALYLFDAAYRPNLAAVKAAGGIAVNGYLTGGYQDTTTQPAQAHAAGLGYLPTYERGPDELVNATRATGRAVGSAILAAFKRLGIPLDGTVAVYPSVDVSVSGASATCCNEGWRGIRDVIAGKVSVRAYAEGAVIDALAAAGLVDGKCWLAAPTSWPGFNVNDSHICMVQLVGTPVSGTDEDHVITDPHALGAWWPVGSPYATTGELTMDAEAKAAFAALNKKVDDTHARIWACVAIAINGDAAHLNSQAATGPLIKGLNTAVVSPEGLLARVAALQAALDQVAKGVAALQAGAVELAPITVTGTLTPGKPA